MPGPWEIYLVRHAIAEDRGEAWPDDAKRPLTDAGMVRMRRNARGLVVIGVALDVVLTSPFVRARQTADILASAFDPKPTIVSAESLAPGGSFAAVVSELEKHARKARLALVGHEPGIGELAARLIGARRPIEFKKGAVCRIDLDALPPSGPGTLRWLLPPKVMRRLKS
jgi:phosphohistidine phosphatase